MWTGAAPGTLAWLGTSSPAKLADSWCSKLELSRTAVSDFIEGRYTLNAAVNEPLACPAHRQCAGASNQGCGSIDSRSAYTRGAAGVGRGGAYMARGGSWRRRPRPYEAFLSDPGREDRFPKQLVRGTLFSRLGSDKNASYGVGRLGSAQLSTAQLSSAQLSSAPPLRQDSA